MLPYAGKTRTADPVNLACWLLPMLFAVGLQMLLNPVGAATTPDSLVYLFTADALHHGLGLTLPGTGLHDPERVPLTLWAPLYPLWLSLFLPLAELLQPGARLSASLAGAATLANGVTLAALALLLQGLLRRLFERRAACVLTLALLASPALQLVQTHAWSETLCLPLLLGAFIACRQRDPAGQLTPGAMVGLCALMALAMATRYASVAFLPVVMLEVLVPQQGRRPATLTAVRRAGGVLAAILLLLAPMWWRNLTLSGHFSGGDRTGLRAPLEAYLGGLGASLLHYLSADNALLWLVLVTMLVLGWWAGRTAAADAAHRRAAAEGWRALVWALSYLASLLVLSRLQSIDGDGRMIALVAPFLLFSTLAAARSLRNRVAPLLYRGPLVVLAIVSVGSGLQTLLQVRADWTTYGSPRFAVTRRGGPEYNNFTNNPQQAGWVLLADTLRRAQAVDPVLTDIAPLPLRFVTGLEARQVNLTGASTSLRSIDQWARRNGPPKGALLLTQPEQIAAFRRLADVEGVAAQAIAFDPRLAGWVMAVSLPMAPP